jgi:5'-nucleotidase
MQPNRHLINARKGIGMFIHRFRTRQIYLACTVALISAAISAAGILSGAAQTQRNCPVRVTLLQVNDVYQFAPTDGGLRGGLARVLTLRKKILTESPHTLFLLAGDTISPSIESNTYKGKQMIDAWNLVGLDYATFGNHEFDFGPDVLRQRMGESRFKWLAANVVDKKTGKLFADPEYVIREFEGVKIGIFGIVLQETMQTSRPGPDIDILDPCTTATRVVPKIHAAGAQVVVALTHLAMADDKKLARCAGVDLIIGGHEHTLLESVAGHAPIFKMTSDARELGRIDLNINRTTGQLDSIDWEVVPVTDQIQNDLAFAALDRTYGPLLKTLEQRVGRTDVQLDVKSADLRTRETNLGNFIADAFRQATDADVALVNGGSVRADTTINPGILTKRDVLSILPFNNKVVKIEVTGAIIRAALEHGVASLGEEAQPGRFPQVSGARYTFDVTRKPGNRIVSVTIGGIPLDDHETYTLATTNYVALDAGDGYTMFRNAKLLLRAEAASTESDILQKAISSVSSIAPKIDGRITQIEPPRNQTSCP